MPDFTPVFLLTGFLGSGKTTLLARLLRDPALADSAVLINEFGEVGLDHLLVEAIDETMVLLGSGCLCCTIRGELASAIRDLHAKRERGLVPPFKRLVIETTGLADPTPALSTITADPVLRHHFRIGGVIATIDAVNGLEQLSHQPESVKQAAVADRLVLTKTDLCGAESIADLVAALRDLNPDAPILRATDEGFDPAELLGERPLVAAVTSGMRCIAVGRDGDDVAPDHHRTRAGEAASFSLVVDQPLDWTAFGLWLTLLLNRHGDRILRVKGLLDLVGNDAPVAIHGVQRLVQVPTHLPAWPTADRRSRLVFITRGLDPGLIARSMRAFGVLGGA